MKRLILYADKDIIKVFVDGLGSVNDIKIIKADGRIYVDIDVLLNVIGWKIEETNEVMQVYTYRRL